MDVNVDLFGGGWASFEAERLVRLSKRPDLDPHDPPTQITLEDGVILSTDSMRTIEARMGDAVPTSDLDVEGSDWPDTVALRKVTHLTKPSEDMSGGDPTLVHLSNGEALLARESIRTLDARLELRAGIRPVALDLPGTERPASLVPDHVLALGEIDHRIPGQHDARARAYVVMAGAWSLECADDPEWLSRQVREGRARPGDEPAPDGPRA